MFVALLNIKQVMTSSTKYFVEAKNITQIIDIEHLQYSVDLQYSVEHLSNPFRDLRYR